MVEYRLEAACLFYNLKSPVSRVWGWGAFFYRYRGESSFAITLFSLIVLISKKGEKKTKVMSNKISIFCWMVLS